MVSADPRNGTRRDVHRPARKHFSGILARVFAWMLWAFLAVMAFIWYGARYLPEQGVSIRIAASAVSDSIWYVPGFLAWMLAFSLVFRQFSAKSPFRSFIVYFTASILSALLLLLEPDAAFRFLFVPALMFVLNGVRQVFSREKNGSSAPILPFSVIIVLMGFYYGWQLVPRVLVQESASPDFTVLTYNIFQRANMERRQEVIDLLRKESPDIACLVETMPGRDETLFRDELGNLYPHIVSTPAGQYDSSCLVLSKFPVKRKTMPLTNISSEFVEFQFFELTVRDNPLMLVVFHLLTVGHQFERIHRREGNIQERLAATTERESTIDETRYQDVQRICAVLNTIPGPIILCGDMNDTANSRIYRIFSDHYLDSFAGTGWGPGATFGEQWMMSKPKINSLPFSACLARDLIRIDYIFAGGGLTPVSSKIIRDAPGSDHKPVLARIRFAE